jgi:hypothetical protein
MAMNKWKILAAILATYLQGRLPSLSRAVLMIGNPEDSESPVVVFGKGKGPQDEKAWFVMERLRQRLREAELEELAFSPSRDGSSWAVVVRVEGGPFETGPGRGFQAEMQRARLEEVVHEAWDAARRLGLQEEAASEEQTV